MFRVTEDFGNDYRAFCRNELSVNTDNDGGVCKLDWIDTYYYKGVPYPDEIKLPIFSRDHATGAPAYGPALQLYTKETNGRVLPHRPTNPTFSLSRLYGGDAAQTYELLLDGGRLLWECTCAADERESLLFCVADRYLYNGTLGTHKDHHRGKGSTQSGDHYEEAGVTLDVDLPHLNGTVDVSWQPCGFDAAREVLLYRGTLRYPYGVTEYVIAVGADALVTVTAKNGMTELRMPWGDRPCLHVGMALAHTEEDAIASLRDGLRDFTALRYAQGAAHEVQWETACTVRDARLPFAEEFGRATAAYLDTLTVGGGCGVRAAAGKYGFFSIWDTIYPIRDFLWNGRFAEAARILDYLFRLPAMENTPISALHLIAEWNEAMAFLPEDALEDMYPYIRKFFDFAWRLTEPQYRLILCKGNTGVDKPEQMGLDGLFLSPDVNGLWYCVCRIVRNEALRHEDADTAQRAEQAMCGMERGFRAVFFDESVGYLRAAAQRDLTPAAVAVYHNTLTLGYDYPYGMYLLRDMVPSLAHYQSHELYHPLGHRAVAYDSDMPADWWRYVHMNQHNGHEMKLQRMANTMGEVHRVMGEVMRRSDRWKNAEETTNFSRFAIHPDQVCDWQSFGATAQNEAMRAGVAGLWRHRGGIGYLPAEDSGDIAVLNIPSEEGNVSVSLGGTGAYGVWYRDNEPIVGTLQLPADMPYTKELRLRRTDALPSHPVLVSAIDLPICEARVTETSLVLTCGATVHTPMVWLCTSEPTVSVGDKIVKCAWDADRKMATLDRVWREGDTVEISVS